MMILLATPKTGGFVDACPFSKGAFKKVACQFFAGASSSTCPKTEVFPQ